MHARTWLLVSLSLALTLAGCGARSSVIDAAEESDGTPGKDARSEGRRDGRARDGRRDIPVDWRPLPDQKRDKFIWPDLPKPKDSWPWPHDGYPGTSPFGCQTESDCFGQKCCPTPWNIKLCAPDCSQI